MDKSIPCYIYDGALGRFYDAVIIDNKIYAFEDSIKEPPRDVLFDPEDQIELFVAGHPEHHCFYDIEPQDRIPARWGYYNINTGEILLPPVYTEAGYFEGEMAWVKRDGKYGFINREGLLLSDYIWDWVEYRHKLKLWAVKKNDNWSYINNSGVVIMEPDLDK